MLRLAQRFITLIRIKTRQIFFLRPVVLRERDSVPFYCVFMPSAIAIAVRTIECITFIQVIPIGQRDGMGSRQNGGVLQILIGVLVARPAASRNQVIVAVQNADARWRRFLTTDEFVQHRQVFEPFAIVYYLRARVIHPRFRHPELQVIFVKCNFRRNGDGAMQFIVRVKHEQQVGFIERPFERKRTVVPKINPLVAMQLSWNVFFVEEFRDYLSGVVARTRVANDPVVKPYFGTQHVQSSTNDVRLILDNHVQAYRHVQ